MLYRRDARRTRHASQGTPLRRPTNLYLLHMVPTGGNTQAKHITFPYEPILNLGYLCQRARRNNENDHSNPSSFADVRFPVVSLRACVPLCLRASTNAGTNPSSEFICFGVSAFPRFAASLPCCLVAFPYNAAHENT